MHNKHRRFVWAPQNILTSARSGWLKPDASVNTRTLHLLVRVKRSRLDPVAEFGGGSATGVFSHSTLDLSEPRACRDRLARVRTGVNVLLHVITRPAWVLPPPHLL